MGKFYFLLWIRWVLHLTFYSLFLAATFSFLITSGIYIFKKFPELTSQTIAALFDIFVFWFPLFFSFTILIALFRGLRHIFNICINGFELKLLACDSGKTIENIGYGDLLKVWRKWLMLLIWSVGSIMITVFVFMKILGSYKELFEWFNIYWLYSFILVGGYFSFILLISRCKKVKVAVC